MLKKLGFLSVLGLCIVGTSAAQAQFAPAKMPTSVIVCRSKQCAPAKISMSKEYIFNTILHMLDSNARKKALICEANAATHSCTEQFVSVPITVGVAPAYMYVDDVKITDVSMSPQNTMALNLVLNWHVSYNGQTPVCRPSKTLLYAKDVNNIIMEDNGYACRMTTVGVTSIKTMIAIDYVDIDYGYIGGFYSIGLSGPAYGGGNGYMILRLPNDIANEAADFTVPETHALVHTNAHAVEKASAPAPSETVNYMSLPAGAPVALPPQAAVNAQYLYDANTKQFIPLPVAPVSIPVPQPQNGAPVQEATVTDDGRAPAPNVSTIIRYNHPAKQYDEKKEVERIRAERDARKKAYMRKDMKDKAILESEDGTNFGGVQVFPVSAAYDKPKASTAPNLQDAPRSAVESRRFQ
ncbi:MAG: hypothetical protein IKN71_08940 [Alphaproteobacteria bacterium]|nr:hypothetical protein [Alphaproteobacteria bacterium]